MIYDLRFEKQTGVSSRKSKIVNSASFESPWMTSPLRKGDGFGNVTYMAQHAFLIEQEPLVVHTRPVIDMDEEQFFQFCQLNRDLQIERTAEGDIIIRAPEGGSSGRGSSTLNAKFERWAERDGTGQVFGSSTGFTLPNGAHEHKEGRADPECRMAIRFFSAEINPPLFSLGGNSISEFRLNSAGFEFVEDPSPVRSQKYDFF
jgi:hypothetical protein